VSGSQPPPLSATDAFNNSGAPGALELKSSGIPKELIRNALELPFAVAAGSTGYHGFALKKDESEPLVPAADHLLAQYLPALGPDGPLYMLSFSLLGLGLVKFAGYQEWKRDHKKAPGELRETVNA